MNFNDRRALDILPARIAALETRIAELNAVLADPDLYARDPARFGATTGALAVARDEAFLDLPNVIGSPHNSAGGGAWRDEYLRRAVQNCRRAVLGETLWNLIGPDERML